MRKLDRAEYDSEEGIVSFLKHYPHFHAVLAERRATAERGESLDRFVVLRAFVLDEFGQLGKLDGNTIKMLHAASAPLCMSHDSFQALLPPDFRYSVTLLEPVYLPPVNVTCPVCGKYYGTDDCHDVAVWKENTDVPLNDFVGRQFWEVRHSFKSRHDAGYSFYPDMIIRNDRFIDPRPKPYFGDGQSAINNHGWVGETDGIGDWYVIQPGDESNCQRTTYFHHGCFRSWMTEKSRKEFETVFQSAGIVPEGILEAVPNEYGSFEYNGAWFVASTSYGKLRIGWRKRVIEIVLLDDWPIDCAALFADEGVTVGRQLVHAWSHEKATQYLNRIVHAMSERCATDMPA